MALNPIQSHLDFASLKIKRLEPETEMASADYSDVDEQTERYQQRT